MGEEIIKFKGRAYEISTVEDLYHILDDINNTMELTDYEEINIKALLLDTIDFQESDTLNDIECINFMNNIMKELEIISVQGCKNYMENLVWQRFDSKKQLEEELSKDFHCKIKLEKQSYCNGNRKQQEEYDSEMLDLDYGLIGNIDNGEIFCDIDIYYAKTRANKGKGIIITEVGYEFETSQGLVDETCFRKGE